MPPSPAKDATISIRRVDGSHPTTANLIRGLQLVCLPSDEVYPIQDSLWWIATVQGCVAGFGGLKILKLEPHACFLCRAGVLDTYRGRGLHCRLIRARVAEARRRGLTYVMTYTLSLNAASSNNLIHEGFKTYSPKDLWAGASVIYWLRELRK